MARFVALASTILLLVAGAAWAQDDAASLHTATGNVLKTAKGTVTVQTRDAKGGFGKSVALKVTGTTKIHIVSHEKRGGKVVPIQRDADAKELKAGQRVAVIYAGSGGDDVLLSAVVLPSGGKKE